MRAVWNDAFGIRSPRAPLDVHQPSRLYVFASGTWIAFCCGSLCWEGHKDEPAYCSLLLARSSEKGGGDEGIPGQKGQLPSRPAVPAPQCGHRSEAGLGGIQLCVSCTFKAASEGMKSSQFFHFRGSACEKGGGGENLGGAAPGPMLPPLLPFANRSARNLSAWFRQASHITVYGSQERGPKSLSSVPVSKVLGP